MEDRLSCHAALIVGSCRHIYSSSLLIFIGPGGAARRHSVGQRSTMPGQRLRIAAVEPAPAQRASGKLIGVARIVAIMMAAVEHLRLRKRRHGTTAIGAAESRNESAGSRETIAPPATPRFWPTPSTRAPIGGHRFVPIQRASHGRGASPQPQRGARQANGE
jgi:hypothetical protein